MKLLIVLFAIIALASAAPQWGGGGFGGSYADADASSFGGGWGR